MIEFAETENNWIHIGKSSIFDKNLHSTIPKNGIGDEHHLTIYGNDGSLKRLIFDPSGKIVDHQNY